MGFLKEGRRANQVAVSGTYAKHPAGSAPVYIYKSKITESLCYFL